MPNPPVPSVKVDWANDGNYSGTYDDITTNVLSFTWFRGSADGGSKPGGATIRVRNYDGKYNPENSGGVLYGNLLPGRAVHIMATYDGTPLGIFGGYIDRIIPIAAGGVREAELICSDAFARWDRRRVLLYGLFGGLDNAQAVRWETITNVDPATYVLAPVEETMALIPIGIAYHGATTLLNDLNAATGSRHVIRPLYNPVGNEGWYYLAVDRTYHLSTAADETLTNVRAIDGYEVTGENVINAATVAYTPLDMNSATETFPVPWTPITVPDGTTETVIVQLGATYTDMNPSITSSGAGGSIEAPDFGSALGIIITASGADKTVTAVTLTAKPVVEGQPVEVSSTDSASIAVYGEQSGGSISSQFLRTQTAAKGLANYLLWRYKDARKRPRITLSNLFPTVLIRDVFDNIAITVSALNVTARRFEIVEVNGSMSQAHSWDVTFSLLETAEQGTLTDWFTLGTSALGGTHKLAW